MEKVKINQTVANWIENAKSLYNFQAVDSLLMWRVLENIRSEQMIEDEIDIVTLAKAIQYGYEVEYEFKKDDLVRYIHSNEILRIGETLKLGQQTTLERMKILGFESYELICKAENREDLK